MRVLLVVRTNAGPTFFGPAFKKHERSHDAGLNCLSYQ